MPLYAPSSGGGEAPNIIYAECNTPPSGTSADVQYDAWYNAATTDITGTKTAVLATIGLTYAAGVFQATEAGVWMVTCEITPEDAPTGQVNTVRFGQSGFNAGERLTWDEATLPLAQSIVIHSCLYLQVSDTFRVIQDLSGSVTDNTPINYAITTITRLQ